MQLIPYGEAQKLLLSRDITRLERVETMRRDFVANVSHELRTPLTVLAGFSRPCGTRARCAENPRLREPHGRAGPAHATHRRRSLALSALESSPEPSLEERVDIQGLLARVKATPLP